MFQSMKTINRPIIVSFLFGVLLLTTLFILCFKFAPAGENYELTVCFNILVFVAGWAVGWMGGTLFAPYDEKEAGLFSQVSKGIWGFLSGYIFAKMDKFINIMHESHVLPLDNLSGFRILLFMSVTIVILLIVFFARKYGDWHLRASL